MPTTAETAPMLTSDLPKQETGEHNALADARHNQTVRRWLAGQEARTP